MTNWLEDLRSYLIPGVGTEAQVHRDLMPDEPVIAMSLHGDAGELPELTLDGKMIMHPGLQLMVRDTDSDQARERLEQARRVLTAIEDLTIGGTRFQEVRAVQEAMPLGTDDTGAFIIVQNFIVTLTYDSLAQLARGTKLVWNGSEVAEVLNLGDLVISAAVKDTSWGAQKWKSSKPGILEAADIEVTGVLLKDGDSVSFYRDLAGRVTRPCEIRLPAGFGLSLRFEAFVRELRTSFASTLKFTALVHVTGAVELAVTEA